MDYPVRGFNYIFLLPTVTSYGSRNGTWIISKFYHFHAGESNAHLDYIATCLMVYYWLSIQTFQFYMHHIIQCIYTTILCVILKYTLCDFLLLKYKAQSEKNVRVLFFRFDRKRMHKKTQQSTDKASEHNRCTVLYTALFHILTGVNFAFYPVSYVSGTSSLFVSTDL